LVEEVVGFFEEAAGDDRAEGGVVGLGGLGGAFRLRPVEGVGRTGTLCNFGDGAWADAVLACDGVTSFAGLDVGEDGLALVVGDGGGQVCSPPFVLG